MRREKLLNLAVLGCAVAIGSCCGCASSQQIVDPATTADRSPLKSEAIDLTTGLAEEDLARYLGRRITFRGYWSPNRVQSPAVTGPAGASAEVWIDPVDETTIRKENTLVNSGREGCLADVTGTLKFADRYPPIRPDDGPIQRVPPHYYVEIGEATVTFP